MMTTEREQAHLTELKEAFIRIGGADGLIDQEEFREALGIADQYFATKIFSLFDKDGSGSLEQEEFLQEVERLISATKEQKLRFAFDLHDADGGGFIDNAELTQLLKASLVENKLAFSPEQVASLVNLLFRKADLDDNGKISFAEFKEVVEDYPDLLQSMTVSPLAWFKPRQRESVTVRDLTADLKRYLTRNLRQLMLLALYLMANLLLFFDAALSKDANIYLKLAQGTGAMLYFNGALILIPMMRSLLTRLRSSALSDYIALDQRVDFHKLIGQVMFATALLHTIAHLYNYTTQPLPFILSLFATQTDASGFFLLLILAVIWATAQSPIRTGGYFKLFYLAHTLYLLWFIVALIHAPSFWLWLIVPLGGFAVERVLRYLKSKEPTTIQNGQLLPGRVLALELRRPEGFHYQPGDYLYLNCPAISTFEWHPFIISSPPEEEERLTLHIRAIGSWTGALYNLFASHQQNLLQANQRPQEINLPVYLDGPYGTPTDHIFDSQVAVLISAGIGITSFISILKSLLARKQNGTLEPLQKVHFFWLNRGQKSFQWLLALLSEIESNDTEQLFDLHIYMTDAHSQSDIKSSTLFIAMDLLHEKTQVDLITGLKTPTQTGSPDWEALFSQIAAQHPEHKVDVYFCGPLALSTKLNKLSHRFDFGYRKQKF